MASQGEVCPGLPASSSAFPPETPGSGPRACNISLPAEDHVELVGFTDENGSVSKMAIVRSRLARVLGRYLLGQPIAAGGMATVHLGRLLGPAGFSRTVAVKRLHAHLAANPEFVQRFVDEARIASRVRHGNVVQTLDVVALEEELLLVLDYVHGESLARLRRRASALGTSIPPKVAAGIVIGVLRGLHAAHEAKSAKGAPLHLVHRDVSPQNILVGADGVPRVLDFGVAKAAGRVAETLTKDIKGKLAYMPPEQLAGDELDRRSDLFAVGVVLWEALAGERLFRGEDTVTTIDAIYNREAPRLADRGLGVSAAVDEVLARALAKDINGRFDTAQSMARALERALPPASAREIAEWVESVAGDILVERAEQVAAFEGDDTGGSKARMFAAAPASGTTARRDALVPPPLDSVTNENTTMQGRAGTIARLEVDAARALAAAPPLGSIELDGVSEQVQLHTPFVMVAPADASAVPESGATRIEPVERRTRVRTPIPMPMPLSPRRQQRARSVLQLAALVIAPPLLVALALAGVRSSEASRARHAAAAPPAVEMGIVAPPRSALVAPPSAVTEAAAAAEAAADAKAKAESDAKARAESDARAKADAKTKAESDAKARSETTSGGAGAKGAHKTSRPAHRAPRIARPVPIAVNR